MPDPNNVFCRLLEELDVSHKYINKQDNVGAQQSSPSDGVKMEVVISRTIPTTFLGRTVLSNSLCLKVGALDTLNMYFLFKFAFLSI